jgi:hypothetical protein
VSGTPNAHQACIEKKHAMSPYKQHAVGLSACRLVLGRGSYALSDGSPTQQIAITVSLLRAEPALRRLFEAPAISIEEALALGYRIVRSYREAEADGLV